MGSYETGGTSTAPSCAHKFCRDGGVLEADGIADKATGLILQRLLTPLALISVVGCLAFVFRDLMIDAASLPLITYVTTAAVIAIALWLFFGGEHSLPKLRIMELVLVYAVAVQAFAIDYERIVEAGASGDPGLVVARVNTTLLGFVILMAAYAIFIPNRWQRSLIVILPLSLATPAVWGLVAYRHPNIAELAMPAFTFRFVTDLVLLGALAGVICVLGTALIGAYRSVAMEARTDNLYDLREQIGKGGMGEVWLAEHKTLARPAAMKIVRPDLLADGGKTAGQQAVRRFAKEARATAALRSPHTVEIYDFGTTEAGVFYYVMEYLDGMDLGTLVERHGPIPAARAIYILRQICASLEDAHANGLIHRDIKPANIFACRLGTEHDFVKVLDFGLVKDQNPNEETQLTVEGLTTGTPAYMAPEMALQNGDIGPGTDIYAVGCVAYWLLTGKLVFDEPTPVAMIVGHVKSTPEAPSTRTELPISAALDEVILRCLEKDPARRFANMRELSEALLAVDMDRAWDAEGAREWWGIHQPADADLARAS